MPVLAADIAQLLDDAAEAAETLGRADGYDDVVAVAVIHADGVRVMTFPKMLAAADPAAVRDHLAALSDMLTRGRGEGLH